MNAVSPTTLQLAELAFRTHGRELLRFIGGPDAEDLLQEVFVRFLKMKSTDGIQSLKAYLYQIARHVCYERNNERKKEVIQYDSEMAEDLADTQLLAGGQRLEDEQSASEYLDSVLANLKPTHRTVLTLHKGEGLSYKETAARAGVSIHTVKKYLFQAVRELRERRSRD